jgi:glycogen debranching enzyme
MGSVFPFLTQYQCIAALRSGLPGVGWRVLRSQVALMHFAGLGYMPEFLPGDRARLLPHVVPHQVFSHAALLECVLDGLLGLTRDASTGEVHAQLALSTPLGRVTLERVLGDPARRVELG